MLVNDTAQKSSCFESLSLNQQAELITFVTGLIQGALTYKDTFTVPDIVGGKFSNWSNTPLDYIYQYHCDKIASFEDAYRLALDSIDHSKDPDEDLQEVRRIYWNTVEDTKRACAEAGKDVGRIVKYIMSIDKHRFYKIVDTEQRRYPVNVYALVKIDSE